MTSSMAIDCSSLEFCDAFQDLQQTISVPISDNIFLEHESGKATGDFADDATWVLTSSFVVLTMQSGFGLLEVGSSTSGFEVNIMIKNVADVVFTGLSYWLFGYGISFGNPSNSFMGLGNFCPDGTFDPTISGLFFSKYIFQFSFAATSTTIVSGSVAMRMKFLVYCIFAFFAVLIYAFVAHWVWADDGWLRQLGMHDFAGGGPVHLVGGMNSLVAVCMIGPRTGRFDGSRPKRDFQPSSPVSMIFGLFMLWWGWIGFNCGSTFGITGHRWVVATRTAISTINATAGGGLTSILYTLMWTKWRQIRVPFIVDGILGSLVAITAACACIRTYDAFLIGSIGAIIAISTNELMKHLKLDDPVGAIGVHLAGSCWGLLAVGLFADSQMPGVVVKDGLFRNGNFELLGAQCIGILAIIGWSATCTAIIFYILGVANSGTLMDPRAGLRVTVEEEMKGADLLLHGIENDWDDFHSLLDDDGKSDTNLATKTRNVTMGATEEEDEEETDDQLGELKLIETAARTIGKNHNQLDVSSGSDDIAANQDRNKNAHKNRRRRSTVTGMM